MNWTEPCTCRQLEQTTRGSSICIELECLQEETGQLDGPEIGIKNYRLPSLLAVTVTVTVIFNSTGKWYRENLRRQSGSKSGRSWIRVNKISILPGNFRKISIFQAILQKSSIFQAKMAIYSYFWANNSNSLRKSPLSNILPVHDKLHV